MPARAPADPEAEGARVLEAAGGEGRAAAGARGDVVDQLGVVGAGADGETRPRAQLGEGQALTASWSRPDRGGDRAGLEVAEGGRIPDPAAAEVGLHRLGAGIRGRAGIRAEDHEIGVRAGGWGEAASGETAVLREPGDGAPEGGDGPVVGGAAGGGEERPDLGGAGEARVDGGAVVDDERGGVSDPGAVGEVADPD